MAQGSVQSEKSIDVEFEHHVFDFSITADGRRAAVTTLIREPAPSLYEATAELHIVDIEQSGKFSILTRLPGRRIDAMAVWNGGACVALGCSDWLCMSIGIDDEVRSGRFLMGHFEAQFMAASADGRTLAVVQQLYDWPSYEPGNETETALLLYDLRGEKNRHVIRRFPAGIALSPTGDDVAIDWNHDDGIQVTSVATNNVKAKFQRNVKDRDRWATDRTLTFSHHGRLLAAGGRFGFAVFDITADRTIAVHTDETVEITECQFSKDDRELVTAHQFIQKHAPGLGNVDRLERWRLNDDGIELTGTVDVDWDRVRLTADGLAASSKGRRFVVQPLETLDWR